MTISQNHLVTIRLFIMSHQINDYQLSTILMMDSKL